MVDEHQPPRRQPGELPDELGSDRAACPRDEHARARDERLHRRRIDLHDAAPQHVFVAVCGDLRRRALPDESLHGRQGERVESGALCGMVKSAQGLRCRAGHRQHHRRRAEVSRRRFEIGRRSAHAHAQDPGVGLRRVVVEQRDGSVRTLWRTEHRLHRAVAALAGANGRGRVGGRRDGGTSRSGRAAGGGSDGSAPGPRPWPSRAHSDDRTPDLRRGCDRRSAPRRPDRPNVIPSAPSSSKLSGWKRRRYRWVIRPMTSCAQAPTIASSSTRWWLRGHSSTVAVNANASGHAHTSAAVTIALRTRSSLDFTFRVEFKGLPEDRRPRSLVWVPATVVAVISDREQRVAATAASRARRRRRRTRPRLPRSAPGRRRRRRPHHRRRLPHATRWRRHRQPGLPGGRCRRPARRTVPRARRHARLRRHRQQPHAGGLRRLSAWVPASRSPTPPVVERRCHARPRSGAACCSLPARW